MTKVYIQSNRIFVHTVLITEERKNTLTGRKQMKLIHLRNTSDFNVLTENEVSFWVGSKANSFKLLLEKPRKQSKTDSRFMQQVCMYNCFNTLA